MLLQSKAINVSKYIFIATLHNYLFKESHTQKKAQSGELRKFGFNDRWGKGIKWKEIFSTWCTYEITRAFTRRKERIITYDLYVYSTKKQVGKKYISGKIQQGK